MKKKNVIFYAVVALIVCFLIFAVIFAPIQACAHNTGTPSAPDDPGNTGNGGNDDPNNPNNPNNPNDPDNPGNQEHVHDWLWQSNSVEHWQYASCHPNVVTERQPHKMEVYYDTAENKNRERCGICYYVRELPTPQEDLKIEFGEDGNASIGGLQDDNITDLVVSGTVTDGNGNEATVTEIADNAFEHSSLKTVIIYDGVERIGKEAFLSCHNLEKIVIPKTVTYIDPEAFVKCSSLVIIIIDADNPVYTGIDNCIIKKDDRCLVIGCNSSKIPTQTDGEGQPVVASIGANAFHGSGITKIEIPGNITSIGAQAFHECTSLTEVTVLEGVTQISSYAFNACSALKKVDLPDSITSIGQNAFAGCSALKEITIPKNVKILDTNTFFGCTELAKVTFQEGFTTIGAAAFNGCTSLKTITLPKSILAIYGTAFNGCTALTEIIYAGTEEEWNAKPSINKQKWIPNGISITFTEPNAGGDEEPDLGDGGDTDSGDTESSDGDADN